MSGFKDILLQAENDLTLTDRFYSGQGSQRWAGSLEVPEDLVMKAGRIYPTTNTNFTIAATGKVTTYPSDSLADSPATGPIFSAGGTLTIEAREIEQDGNLAAPMGEITLAGQDRVYIDSGSRVSAAGETSVAYGQLDDISWTVQDKSQQELTEKNVDKAPEKSIAIEGKEVIVREGATIDISGGGSVFSYQFQPGIEGSSDPLKKAGIYVIVPDGSVSAPGEAVHLTGGNGSNLLGPGTYSLLPESYAFVPGALIIRDLGKDVSAGQNAVTQEGYPVVKGYSAAIPAGATGGTETVSASMDIHSYAIRPASDVLKEGHFNRQEIKADSAGKATIKGDTTILNGDIVARVPGVNQVQGQQVTGAQVQQVTGAQVQQVTDAGQAANEGGILSLSARDVVIQASAASLPEGFGANSPIPDDMKGKLVLSSDSLTGKGLQELNIGGDLKTTQTQTITVKDKSTLDVPDITFAAQKHITLESGSSIQAIQSAQAAGEGGTITLGAQALTEEQEPRGIIIEDGATVHASKAITMNSPELDLQGELKVDNSCLNLAAEKITLVSESYSGDRTGGLYLTSWLPGFEGFDRICLTSESDLILLGDVDLEVKDELTIDAPKIAGMIFNNQKDALIKSAKITLMNTGEGKADPSGTGSSDTSSSDTSDSAPSRLEASSGTSSGAVTLEAGEMTIGRGDVLIEGFDKIHLNSTKDLSFGGAGSLSTGGDLEISAARVTTSTSQNAGSYENAQFIVDAGDHAIAILSAGAASETASEAASEQTPPSASMPPASAPAPAPAPGGILEIKGKTIDHSGSLDVPSGRITFTAADSITLEEGSKISSTGLDDAPGGHVVLQTIGSGGGVKVDQGALVDVSAGKQGDAGAIALVSPDGGVKIDGDLQGQAQGGGEGGSLTLVTHKADDVGMGNLNTKLADGGFRRQVNVRIHQGDVAIAQGDTVKTRSFNLTADSGNIDVYGTIDASGAPSASGSPCASGASGASADASTQSAVGGSVGLYAAGDITLHDESRIQAQGSGQGSCGGEVHLSAANGSLNLENGSSVDVSAGDADGQGGSVTLRAGRLDSDQDGQMDEVKVTADEAILDNAVYGARRVVVEAVSVHEYDESSMSITSSEINAWEEETQEYMDHSQSIKDRLPDGFSLLPGLEIRNSGGLTLSSPWDLTSWRVFIQSPRLKIKF